MKIKNRPAVMKGFSLECFVNPGPEWKHTHNITSEKPNGERAVTAARDSWQDREWKHSPPVTLATSDISGLTLAPAGLHGDPSDWEKCVIREVFCQASHTSDSVSEPKHTSDEGMEAYFHQLQ